jgi:serine protease AprX
MFLNVERVQSCVDQCLGGALLGKRASMIRLLLLILVFGLLGSSAQAGLPGDQLPLLPPPPVANIAPELGAIGNREGYEGVPLTFTVAATDADGNALIFTATEVPSGASFDPLLRVFTWTPRFGQAGTYPGVTFTVSDGVATDSEVIAITITSGTPPIDKLDPLLQLRASNLSGSSQVIVRAQDALSLDTVALLIQTLGGSLGLRLPIIEAQAASIPNTALLVLADNPSVKRIALDRVTLGTMERTGITIGAVAARQALGYDGSGVGVAVLDSGVTNWHDDLTAADNPGSQRIDLFIDFIAGRATPYDDYGHGTHVAGIIAGNGMDSGGARSGIAPAARLVVMKVLDGAGRGRISDVIGALGYIIDHPELHVRVINLSLGAAVYESYDSDFLTLTAKRAVAHGLVVVAGAGNLGRGQNGGARYGGITAPGNAPWVLTVGASSHMGTTDRADDTIAVFSSRGPTAVDYEAKPDVVAPGVGIESISDSSSLFYASKSAYLLSGTVIKPYLPYLSLSGTSQAAPVVAGVVALMLQANPTLTPNAVKAILEYTAQKYDGYNALTQGSGFLNARGAIELARFFRDPTGQYPLQPEWSRQIIWGNRSLAGGVLLPGTNGWSDVFWGSDATASGQPVVWGVICTGQSCETADSWTTWGTTCSDAQCTTADWSATPSENVVWGATCGGDNCNRMSATSDDDTVVWGNSDDDTVVWGNSDDDTVVWGNSDGEYNVVW